MQRYNLFLLALSLATLQASQQLDLDLNSNNTNEKSRYIHGDLTNWQEWIKDIKYKDLQKPLMDLYRDGIARPTEHIKTTLPVYFVVGPTGAGKRTFIFALQGNQVNKTRSKNWKKSKNEVKKSNCNTTGKLILNKAINMSTPEVAESAHRATKGVKVYYTDEKIKKPMVFCDTQGLLGTREEESSKAEKLVGVFAPHFALKANPIGGIVFLVSSADIQASRGNNLFTCMNFLKDYFDVAMKNDKLKNLKKSIMLVINKEKGSEEVTVEKLAALIQAAYQDYYQGLPDHNEKNHKMNTNQKPEKKEPPLDQRQHFFSLFLKKDINHHTIKNRIDKYANDLKTLDKIKDNKSIEQHEADITNFFNALIDADKVHFFYPDDKDNAQEIRQAIGELTFIQPKYISLQNNRICPYLINQIMYRAYAINQDIHKTLKWINLVQLQNLMLQRDITKTLKALSFKLQQRKKELKQQKKEILYNKMLQCVYDQRHIQDIPWEKRKKEREDLGRVVIEKVKKRSGLGLSVGGGIGVVVGGGVGGVGGGLVGGVVGGLIGGGLGLLDGVFEGVKRLIRYRYQGYLHKHVTYTGDEPIWKIKIKSDSKGTIAFYSPKSNFIAKHFNTKAEGNTIIFTSKNKNGFKQNLWHIVHCTAYQENARCHVQFFSKKKDLKASKWQRKDKKNKMSRIDDLLKNLGTFKTTNKDKLEKDHLVNQGVADKHIKALCKLQEEMSMINCWSNRILKKDSANRELIEQYRHNYNDAVPDKYQVSIQDDNDYNNMTSSYKDNTNTKYSDNQPELQLNNNYQHMDGEEKCKEDNEDNHNNQNISSSSAPLTITAILAGLLPQQN